LPGSGAAQPAETGPTEPDLAQAHQLINRHRASVGCDTLAWHEPAAEVAGTHSRDMSDRGFFDHVNPDGIGPGGRLLAAGVTWTGYAAENIAQTPAGATSAGEMWLDSASHRENIERCEFTHHGIGGYDDLWTEVLIQDPHPGR
jgi:uncharacterized protein YkwD